MSISEFLKQYEGINPVIGWGRCEDLEYQVNVDGEFAFRNVAKANTAPELKNHSPEWLPKHAELIGSSGWNPDARESVWYGIDVDGLDHVAGITHVDEIVEKCSRLDYVQIQRSKGAQSIHLYGRPTPNNRPRAFTRGDHARNAERFVRQIELDTGLKLLADCDVFGGNMWIWVRDPKPGAFTVLHEATAFIPADLPELPQRPTPAVNDVETVEFDDEHRRIIEAWAATKYAVSTDGMMVRLHCHAPKVAEIDVIGHYDTISPGTEPRLFNSFAYPIANGGFLIVRYKAAKESPPWFTSGAGNTCCLYNVAQDLDTIAERRKLHRYQGAYVGTVAELAEALRDTGEDVATDGIADKAGSLRRENGQYILTVDHKAGEPIPAGWQKHGRRIVVITDAPAVSESDPRIKNELERVYFVIGEANNDGSRDAENFMRVEDGESVIYTEQKLDNALTQDGFNAEQRVVIKRSAKRVRRRVAHFRPMIEDGWFNSGARLKIERATGAHPHWDLIEDHAGQSLTPHLDDWCKRHGITTGGKYLRMVRAIMFQKPTRPTPMLFFYSPEQGSGKSFYIDTIHLLVAGGIAHGTGMLRKDSQFNAHCARAWYAKIVESDISGDGIYDKLKPLISDGYVESEAKFQNTTITENRCHFVQTANHLHYCPVEDGDTRIVVIRVPPVKQYIDTDELNAALTREAPAYLDMLLTMALPSPAGRLWLPIISTPERELLIEGRSSPVKRFIRETVKLTPGSRIPATEFAERCGAWAEERLGQSLGRNDVYSQIRLLNNGIVFGEIAKLNYIINAAWKA